jgi:hypothetical protein
MLPSSARKISGSGRITAYSSVTKSKQPRTTISRLPAGFLPASNRFFDKSTPLAKLEKEKGHGNAVAFTDP